jgi:hypothetical protein
VAKLVRLVANHDSETGARQLIEACDEVVVLMIDGWRESVGVRAEIGLAGELGKRVTRIFAPPAAGDESLE